jgi:hypothetical protein
MEVRELFHHRIGAAAEPQFAQSEAARTR